MGSFPEADEIPSRNDIRRWAAQTWKGIHNVNIYDINGIQFLFEFQSRKGQVEKKESPSSIGMVVFQSRSSAS